MAYTPIAQRGTAAKRTGYVPISQRTVKPAPTQPVGTFQSALQKVTPVQDKKTSFLSKVGSFFSGFIPAAKEFVGIGGVAKLPQQFDVVTQPLVQRTFNTPTGMKVSSNVAEATTDIIPKLWSAARALGSDEAFFDAYNKYYSNYKTNAEERAKDDNLLTRTAKAAFQSAPQSAIGVALSFIPVAGKPLASAYWAALSADEQIKEKGKVTSLGNIAVDVIGDRMLGDAMEGMFKTTQSVLLKTLQGAGIEGSTEVAQTLLKYQNDYNNAKSDAERKAILDQAKNYFTSGDIAVEFGAGALAGAGIAGPTNLLQSQTQVNVPPATITKEDQVLPGTVAQNVVTGNEALVQEARKYKTAEEFVRAQKKNPNIVWHETNAKNAKSILSEGFRTDTGQGELTKAVYASQGKQTTDYVRGGKRAVIPMDISGLNLLDTTTLKDIPGKRSFEQPAFLARNNAEKGIFPKGYDGILTRNSDGTIYEVALKQEVANKAKVQLTSIWEQAQNGPAKQATDQTGITFDRTFKQVQGRLNELFGTQVPVAVAQTTEQLGGDQYQTVYGRATGSGIALLTRNETFSEAVANHEGWHWYKRNLNPQKRADIRVLEAQLLKEVEQKNPARLHQLRRDYEGLTNSQLAEELMADEFARFTRTGTTVISRLKVFFEKALEALKMLFTNRDSVMAIAQREFAGVRNELAAKRAQPLQSSQLKRTDEKGLLTVHNITDAKLRFADRIGGLANPSIAVIDPRLTKFEGYGDISLIAPSDILDGERTHLADAYTPRFPTVHSTMPWKEFLRLKEDMKPWLDRVDDRYRFAHDDSNQIREIENSPAVALRFLEENGITPSSDGESYYHVQIRQNKLENQYQNWLDDLYKRYGMEEKIFAGYTNMGRRRYRPLTVEEASKLMSKETAETGLLAKGLGMFRGKAAPIVRSASKVKKNATRLMSTEEFEKVKDAYDKEFWGLLTELEPYAKVWDQNSFIETDYQANAIGGILMGENGALTHFKAKYPTAPDSLINKVYALREKLRVMPTEYFETKFRRPVSINEFSTAVVPQGTDQSVKDILERYGLRVIEYEKDKRQDVMIRMLQEPEAFKKGPVSPKTAPGKAITPKAGEDALLSEARKYKTAEEFVGSSRGRTLMMASKNFPKLGETSFGKNLPDDVVVYRGIKGAETSPISPGDYVTLNKADAAKYGGTIQSTTLPKDSLMLDNMVPGGELVYAPERFTKSQLISLWEQAQSIVPQKAMWEVVMQDGTKQVVRSPDNAGAEQFIKNLYNAKAVTRLGEQAQKEKAPEVKAEDIVEKLPVLPKLQAPVQQAQAPQVDQTQEARARVKETIKRLDLQKTENLRQVLQFPPVSQMTTDQLNQFNSILEQYKTGDEFLSVRKLETVGNTELAGIRTIREARERLAKELGVPVGKLGNIKVGQLDRFRYDTDLAERNPFYAMMVDSVNKEVLNAEARYLDIEEQINKLMGAARKSRGRSILDRFIPQDKRIFAYLEATDADKTTLAKKMTQEEIAAADYIKDQYARMRDYLIQQGTLKKYRQDYITHIRKGFLETWKDDGLLNAFKSVFNQYKQDEATFNIISDTGQILPLEKFFQFSMRRSGELSPTQNVARAFLGYTKAFEKKAALDAVVPKLDIYAHSLTPKVMTPRGLEFDRSLKTFVNEWVNTKKGRTAKIVGIEQGGKIDLLLRAAKGFTALIDLGLNIPIGIASRGGENITNFTMLGTKNYAKGLLRTRTEQGKKILAKYKNFTGRSVFSELADVDENIAGKLAKGIFGLFHDATYRANRTFLLGSMTDEEFKNGEISPERLAQLRREMGRYRNVEGAKSIFGSTSVGGILTQYKSWAIPILRTVTKNLRTVAQTRDLGSREAQELLRASIVTTLAVLAARSFAGDDEDKSFAGTILSKAYRDALSLIGALDPKLWLATPRVISFISDLGNALSQIIKLETYADSSELKGTNTLARTVIPRSIQQFLPESVTKKNETKKGGIPALPALPKLPKLPKLPQLPTI